MKGLILYDEQELNPTKRIWWPSFKNLNFSGGAELPTETSDIGINVSATTIKRPMEISFVVGIHEEPNTVSTSFIYSDTKYDLASIFQNLSEYGAGARLKFMSLLEEEIVGKKCDLYFGPDIFFENYCLISWSFEFVPGDSASFFTLNFIKKLEAEVFETALVIKHKASNVNKIIDCNDEPVETPEETVDSDNETLLYDLWEVNQNRKAEAYKENNPSFRQSIGRGV